MRAVKKTALNFGLVSVPIRMYLAGEDHTIAFHQHHGGGCNGGFGQQRVCKECGEVVACADIVKGIDHDGQLIIVTPEELAGLEDGHGNQIEILQFCPASDVEPISYAQPYYCEPSDGGADGYSLLRQALVGSNLVAVVRFVMRTKTTLGILRVLGNVMVVHTTHWPDEIRNSNELKVPASEIELDPKAVKMAAMLEPPLSRP
jgi:DNA end-binding protein Ku